MPVFLFLWHTIFVFEAQVASVKRHSLLTRNQRHEWWPQLWIAIYCVNHGLLIGACVNIPTQSLLFRQEAKMINQRWKFCTIEMQVNNDALASASARKWQWCTDGSEKMPRNQSGKDGPLKRAVLLLPLIKPTFTERGQWCLTCDCVHTGLTSTKKFLPWLGVSDLLACSLSSSRSASKATTAILDCQCGLTCGS